MKNLAAEHVLSHLTVCVVFVLRLAAACSCSCSLSLRLSWCHCCSRFPGQGNKTYIKEKKKTLAASTCPKFIHSSSCSLCPPNTTLGPLVCSTPLPAALLLRPQQRSTRHHTARFNWFNCSFVCARWPRVWFEVYLLIAWLLLGCWQALW